MGNRMSPQQVSRSNCFRRQNVANVVDFSTAERQRRAANVEREKDEGRRKVLCLFA